MDKIGIMDCIIILRGKRMGQRKNSIMILVVLSVLMALLVGTVIRLFDFPNRLEKTSVCLVDKEETLEAIEIWIQNRKNFYNDRRHFKIDGVYVKNFDTDDISTEILFQMRRRDETIYTCEQYYFDKGLEQGEDTVSLLKEENLN